MITDFTRYSWERREKHRIEQRIYRAKNSTRGKRTCLMKNAHAYVERHPEIKKDYCELCPETEVITENLQAHHLDYEFPHIIVTCCPSCHKFMENNKDAMPKM